MYVYVLMPVDCLEMMMTYEEFLNKFRDPNFFPSVTIDEVVKEADQAKKLFTEAGWEGDGDLRIMWIPPFFKDSGVDSLGDFAYFIKQGHNGTCYVCSHRPIPIDKECDLT